MLRISKLTDYGTLVMAHLAGIAPDTQSATQIAAGVRLAQPTVSKLLKALVHAKLLVSERGARGGYRLARPPETISLAHIIAALEGPVAVTECSEAEGICNCESSCTLRDNWQIINRNIRQVLAGLTLADITRQMNTAPAWPTTQVGYTPAAGGTLTKDRR